MLNLGGCGEHYVILHDIAYKSNLKPQIYYRQLEDNLLTK